MIRRITPIWAVIGLAFLGSAVVIVVAILRVRDTSQIPMLSTAFAVMGLSLIATAVLAVAQIWQAATDGTTGRAVAMGLVGGIVALGAIGCFTAAVLLALLWSAG